MAGISFFSFQVEFRFSNIHSFNSNCRRQHTSTMKVPYNVLLFCFPVYRVVEGEAENTPDGLRGIIASGTL